MMAVSMMSVIPFVFDGAGATLKVLVSGHDGASASALAAAASAGPRTSAGLRRYTAPGHRNTRLRRSCTQNRSGGRPRNSSCTSTAASQPSQPPTLVTFRDEHGLWFDLGPATPSETSLSVAGLAWRDVTERVPRARRNVPIVPVPRAREPGGNRPAVARASLPGAAVTERDAAGLVAILVRSRSVTARVSRTVTVGRLA
jgi:hypothetical protein